METKIKNLEKPEKSKEKQDTKFKKGQSGNPNGRPKGSKSYKTMAIEELLEDLGCNPIEGMVALAEDENTDTSIRAKLYSELAAYLYPKRRAVEIKDQTFRASDYLIEKINEAKARMAKIRDKESRQLTEKSL
ncbi:MAG: DUF5681 domain-containing protein [Nitrospinales bacterium]